jgi:hypothetical protein
MGPLSFVSGVDLVVGVPGEEYADLVLADESPS